jgi:hypothetical protein
MTLREKRHAAALLTLQRSTTQRDACLAKLVRYELKLTSLRRQVQRLAKALAAEPTSKPMPATVPVAVEAKPVPDIPTFLQRSKEADAKDAAAAAAIKAEQAERKKLKATIRSEERAAKASGATKRMPLTGREALQYLKTGSRA